MAEGPFWAIKKILNSKQAQMSKMKIFMSV